MRHLFIFALLLLPITAYAVCTTNGTAGTAGYSIACVDIQSTLTGWFAYNLPADTGGIDTPASYAQTINNPSPSLNGASMLLSETTNATSTQTNILFVNKMAPICDTCNTVTNQFNVYIPSASLAALSSFEADQFNFVLPSNVAYMFGHQCNFGTHLWQIANEAGPWVNTALSCSTLTADTWHTIYLQDHWVPGDTTCGGAPCLYFDSITVDGTTTNWNLKLASTAIPGGFGSSLVGNQFQLDIGPTTGTPKTASVYIDQANFYAGVNGVTATGGALISGSTIIGAIIQ